MKVAAIQMVSTSNISENLQTALRLLKTAAQGGATIVVLPEYFCAMSIYDEEKLQYAENDGDLLNGPIQTAISQAAKDLNLWVVAGTLPLRSPDSPKFITNSCLVYDTKGEQVIRYDKIHLFRFDNGIEHYNEASVNQAGTTPKTFYIPTDLRATPLKVGLSVCYDIRFPELYRQLSAPFTQPCDIITVAAAFTAPTGQAHWEIILRARAIENQCYIIASAQGGTHENGRKTWGHSMIIDPWGQILSSQAQGEAVIFADVDMEYLDAVRKQLPALKNRMLVD